MKKVIAGNPPLGEVLQHYGVLGMKWGVTRARARGTDIRGARGRTTTQGLEVHRKTSQAERIKDPVARAAAKKEAEQLRMDYLKNPDRVIASRLTRGEKAAVAILSLTSGVGVLPAAAAIAGTSARSRRIERKQELGKYDK